MRTWQLVGVVWAGMAFGTLLAYEGVVLADEGTAQIAAVRR